MRSGGSIEKFLSDESLHGVMELAVGSRRKWLNIT